MEKEQLIKALWELPFLDLLHIAVIDDFILFCRIWPFLLSFIVTLIVLCGTKERLCS